MEMTQTHIISREQTRLSLLVRQIRFEASGINSYELVHPQGEELPRSAPAPTSTSFCRTG